MAYYLAFENTRHIHWKNIDLTVLGVQDNHANTQFHGLDF